MTTPTMRVARGSPAAGHGHEQSVANPLARRGDDPHLRRTLMPDVGIRLLIEAENRELRRS